MIIKMMIFREKKVNRLTFHGKEDFMYCRQCGNQLQENQKFCINCGTPINADQSQKTLKNDSTLRNEKNIQFSFCAVLCGCVRGGTSFCLEEPDGKEQTDGDGGGCSGTLFLPEYACF